MDGKFLVVEFLKDNTVAVVLRTWLDILDSVGEVSNSDGNEPND